MNDEKMNFYINDDIEDLKIIKLIENTGISTSFNNLNQQSLTFQMNFEESNTVDISTGYAYGRNLLNLPSFIGSLNQFINFTNKKIINIENRKFPTLKILKLKDSIYTDTDYFEDTEEIGDLKTQNPFKDKIYYPFIIPKKYRSNILRTNFNSKLKSENVDIYKSNLYLDYGDKNEKEDGFYNNIKFPIQFKLPSNKLFNCLVFEFAIEPISKTTITDILLTLNTQEDSKLRFVVQLKTEIPVEQHLVVFQILVVVFQKILI